MNYEDLEVGKTYYAAILKWTGTPRVRGLAYVRDTSENDCPLDRFVFHCGITGGDEAYDKWNIKDSFYDNELEALSEHARDLMSHLITCQARSRAIEKKLIQRVGDMEKRGDNNEDV